MSAYTDRIDAARSTASNLFRQIQFAVWVAANDIVNEDPETAKHAKRVDWSRKILNGGIQASEEWTRRVIPQVLMNATIQAAPEDATDSDVQFVVNGLVNNWI